MVIGVKAGIIALVRLTALVFGRTWKDKNRRNYSLAVAGVMLIAVLSGLVISCGKPDIQLETIGRDSTGMIVYVVLASSGNVTDEALAEKLRADWQGNLEQFKLYERITVVVFDSKESAERRLALSPEESSNEAAEINPHIIAAYYRSSQHGQNLVYFYARDAAMSIRNTIRF